MLLTTKRLVIRDLVVEDVNDMYEYAKSSVIGPMAGWSPHTSIAETEYILYGMIASKDVFAIVLKENNKMIGTIGLHKHENGVELGYVLSDLYWGQGIMTEVVLRMIEYVFSKTTITSIFVSAFDYNVRSLRVIEKCGFRHLRDGMDAKYEMYTKTIKYYVLEKEEKINGKEI